MDEAELLLLDEAVDELRNYAELLKSKGIGVLAIHQVIWKLRGVRTREQRRNETT
jgi:hypothetical protein